MGRHFNSVAIWRNRFLAAVPLLDEMEMPSPEKLQAEIKTLLTDDRRSGHSHVFTQEQLLKIIDLACKYPSDFGYETSQWSLIMLVSEI